jgi:cytochrome P450
MEKMHSPKTALKDLPVAPKRYPLVGHLPHVARGLFDFLKRGREELGPIYWYDQGFGAWAVVVDGEPGREVMKNQKTRSDLLAENASHITLDTVLVNDGDVHRRMRGAMSSSFTPRGLSAAEVGDLILRLFEPRVEAWDLGAPLPVHEQTSEFALDVIFHILGVETDELPLWRVKFAEYLAPGIVVPVDLPGTPRRGSRLAGEWMDARFEKLIARAREEGDTESLLGSLVHGADEKGRHLEAHELLANLRILALAGHETTASVMAWMIYHLGDEDRPDLWEALKAEVAACDGPPTTPRELRDFPFAEGLFREALRAYPPVALLPPRRVTEPLEVHGVEIPENTRVTASLIGMTHDPELYPDPYRFDPMRWVDRDKRPGPLESVQFGGGPHFCLGYHLALLEGIQFIVLVARRLIDAGKRIHTPRIPEPRYMPLTRPPGGVVVTFVDDRAG